MPTFEPTNDFPAIADGLEAVTLAARNGDAQAVPQALRRAASLAEHAPSGALVLRSDVVWHLPATLAAPPQIGETIIDTVGESWTILAIDRATLGSRFRCLSRNLAIVHRLDTRIAIEQCTFAKGDHGAPLPLWTTWKTNLPARIQPLALVPEVIAEARIATATHTLYLLDDLALDARHRVRDANDLIYSIEEITHADQIGEPMQLHVRRTTA